MAQSHKAHWIYVTQPVIAQPVIDGFSAQVGILLFCCLGSSVASKSKLILLSIGVINTCHVKYKNI